MKTHIPFSIWMLCIIVFSLGVFVGAVITFGLIQAQISNVLENMQIGDVSINVDFNQTKLVEDVAKYGIGTGSCEAPA